MFMLKESDMIGHQYQISGGQTLGTPADLLFEGAMAPVRGLHLLQRLHVVVVQCSFLSYSTEWERKLEFSVIHLNTVAPYNAWRGQLYIHEQLVCSIALQAPSACSIPTQLSEKLDLKEVIQLSDLRKKLPEDIFQKTDPTGQEVSCGNIYYSLFSVVTSNIVGSDKFDKLLKCLRDQDLALIKVLNDQGFLILVNSTAFQSSTGISDGNSAQLNALFLFPHQRFLDKRGGDEWESKFARKEHSSTITNLLPGLHYAIIESRKLQKDKALYPGPLVEQYFRKHVILQSKKGNSSERKPEQSVPLSVFNSHGDEQPKQCSQLAFSCLQLYVSSPVNFNIPLIRMSNIVAENAALSGNSDQSGNTVGNVIKQDNLSSTSKPSMTADSKATSNNPRGKRAVRGDREQISKRGTKRKSGKRKEKKSKRKSVPRAALNTAETSENQTSNKRKRLLSEDKKQIGSSSEVMVKLASAPYPQRRKRGAEVLTAAFIQDEKIQTTDKIATSKTNEENKNLTQKTKAIKRTPRKILAPEEPFLVPDRPSKRKAADPGNKNMSAGATNKSESLRRTSEREDGKTGRSVKRNQEKIKNVTVEQINTFSKSGESSAQISEDSMIEKRISMYDSHALNLLADLALNSFGSTGIPYIKSGNVASANESLVEEATSTGDSVSTVEPPPKACSLPAQSTITLTEVERILESEIDKPKNGLSVSPRNIASHKRMDNGEKQMSPKAHFAAAKAKARYNALSKICLEHSYSQLPMEDIPGKPAKQANEQPIQGVPDSTTSADIVPPEQSANGLPGETLLLTNESVCPAAGQKQRAVSKFQDNVAITFHWEPKYDFDLDSKFTRDPLEKTINRALHGPWNPNLKEKVEDVKIILHMWIALFYSKSNKQIHFSSRKVVEHSNPAKYVSINTVLDPFEFYEIMELDDVPAAENSNVILPMGKRSELSGQVNPFDSVLSCRLGKSHSKSLQDVTVPPTSIPTKDYNIKLSSEIFQMCKDTESADCSDSLQTSMMGIMAPPSKGAPAPANVMKTIFGTNVPTVCYIGDTNLFNTELADKSENCMHIGGFSSGKAKPKDIEHKYSRHFSRMNEAPKSGGKQAHCKIVSSDADENTGNVNVSFTGRMSQTHSDILSLHEPPTTGESHETASKLELAGNKGKHFSKSIHSLEIPSTDDIRKDITDENPATVEQSPEKDELSVPSVSLLGARVPAAETAESQDPLPATVLPSQEINDHSTNADEPGKPPDAVLQNTEKNDNQVTIPDSCDVVVVGSLSGHNDMNAKFYILDPWMNREALECDKESPGINHVGPDNLRLYETPDRNVHSKSVLSDDVRQVCEHTDTIASNQGSQKMEGLEFGHSPNHSKNIDSDLNVDCNINCTMGGKSNSALDSVGLQEREEKVMENLDEFGNLVEPKNTHELDENVSDKITAADTMSRIKLSNCSDEASDVGCSAKSCPTDRIESGELKSKEKSLKEASEKTEEEEGHSIGEEKISTSMEHSVPVVSKDNSVPEKENVEETDVHEPSHISEASMVEEPEKELPEKGVLTLNVAQNCLNDEDSDLFNEAARDEATKEQEASNHDANMNIDSTGGSLLQLSKKEVPSTQEICATGDALPYTDGAYLVDDHSLVGAGSTELDGIASTSVLGHLDTEVSSKKCTIEDSIQCENHEGHVHNEGLAESQSLQLISQAPFEGDKKENNICSVETVNEKDDALLTIAETQTCQTVVNTSVSSGIRKDMLGGESDVGNSNEKTLQTNIMDSTQQPLDKQSPDLAGDVVYLCATVTPARPSAKDSTHSNRNSSKNKKEILSKLKRICLGSMTGHQVSSSCENVLLSQDENANAGGFTKENEVLDLAKKSLPGDEDKSILKNSDDVAEEPAMDNSSPEESAMTSVEPEILEGVKSSQDVYLISSSLEDVSDSIEQDPAPELPDICFIANTGSISKEQYDRWSETSDEDIEYIHSYKELLPHEEQLQKEIREYPSLFQDKVTCSQEQTTTDRTKKNFQLQSGSNSGLYETDEYFSKHLQDLESTSHTNRGNVNVTRNIKGHGRALRTVTKESSSTSDLDHLFSDRRMVSDDLTQNTLDIENVRFTCKLKDIFRKSATDKHIHGPPFQTMFESRRISSCSHSTVKCRGPLLITVHCPRRRTDFRRHEGWHPSTYNSSPYYEDELWDRPVTSSRTKKKCRTPRYSPFHFSRLRYENSLDKSNNDISVILNECVQSNHLKLSSIGLDSTAVDRTSAIQLAEESDRLSRRPLVPVSSKSQSVKNLISDLCTNLHSRLKNVARASEQKVSFYIYETDDGDFISSAKSLLVKDGHVETDPRAFLSSEHSDSHQLLVIIKNEDVFSCINKIPYLSQLKLLPNVTFAGVDTPEDMTESTHEELFQAGGFVASDKSVLGNITLGKLKEVLAGLEKMNRTSPWKWLIHYRENRKLKDDKRAEPLSRTKMSLLKSYQYSNVIEMLPYHQCDSRSNEPSDDLSCLVNLQYQHIHSRLAVYLTGATSMVTEEYEQNGILVYDVDTFLRKIQKVDSQFQASYWP